MSNNASTCSHCGKPLRKQSCFACDGKGHIQELAFMKRECTVCNGSGQAWRCEDEFKHIVEDFKASHMSDPHAPLKPLKHRRSTEAQEPPEWDINPRRPIHPENPWNLNNLNRPLKTTIPHKTQNPRPQLDRHTIKKK
jgi:hypothetical protein